MRLEPHNKSINTRILFISCSLIFTVTDLIDILEICYSTPEAWNMTFLCHVGEKRSCVYISVYMCRDVCLCLLRMLWKDWVLMSQCFVWWEERVRGWRTASARPTLSVPLFTLSVYSLEGLSLSLSCSVSLCFYSTIYPWCFLPFWTW